MGRTILDDQPAHVGGSTAALVFSLGVEVGDLLQQQFNGDAASAGGSGPRGHWWVVAQRSLGVAFFTTDTVAWQASPGKGRHLLGTP